MKLRHTVEIIETDDYSLLNRRERIETMLLLSATYLQTITPSLIGGRGLKLASEEAQRVLDLDYSLLNRRERIETKQVRPY